jgi:hypothetical protein
MPLQATGKSVELTQRLKSLESVEASSRQQLLAVQQQVERLQQELTEKARSLVLSEAKRDALQSEMGQVGPLLFSGFNGASMQGICSCAVESAVEGVVLTHCWM